MLDNMAENIFLIGFMGTGKTTVSRQLSNILKFVELDMDAEIEHRQNRKISEIFADDGEEYFRDLETKLLEEFRTKDGFIVSCGGGAVLRQENVNHMKEGGITVLLTGEPQTIYERVRHSKNRPLLNNHMNVEYISELKEKRRTAYENAADVCVSTDDKTPEEIAKEIVEKIGIYKK